MLIYAYFFHGIEMSRYVMDETLGLVFENKRSYKDFGGELYSATSNLGISLWRPYKDSADLLRVYQLHFLSCLPRWMTSLQYHIKYQ